MAEAAPSMEQARQLAQQLDEASRQGPGFLRSVLPPRVVADWMQAAVELHKHQPPLLELSLDDATTQVAIVGDTHGHFHDVLHMFDKFGYPSEKLVYVFNGDYVDRGAWGVELFAFLVYLKLASPAYIHLLRGNHESTMCTRFYGFFGELQAKYAKDSKDVYQACKRLFCQLPLACVVQGNTLILHGGLFRSPPEVRRGAKRRKPTFAANKAQLTIGSLDDLRAASKGGMDPAGRGSTVVATDVLWSDPVAAPGFQQNDARGVGLTFGPDITQAFLEQNDLKLIIRSHEGPDARDKRSDLPQVLQGYSWDHRTPAGDLLTVFSAPDYPQFMEDGAERYNNLAAVAVLSAPGYHTPDLRTFEAVRPRPMATAYYDYNVYIDSDEELPQGSEGEGEGRASGSEAGVERGDQGASGQEGCSREAQQTGQEGGAGAAGAGPGGAAHDAAVGEAAQQVTASAEAACSGEAMEECVTAAAAATVAAQAGAREPAEAAREAAATGGAPGSDSSCGGTGAGGPAAALDAAPPGSVAETAAAAEAEERAPASSEGVVVAGAAGAAAAQAPPLTGSAAASPCEPAAADPVAATVVDAPLAAALQA